MLNVINNKNDNNNKNNNNNNNNNNNKTYIAPISILLFSSALKIILQNTEESKTKILKIN